MLGMVPVLLLVLPEADSLLPLLLPVLVKADPLFVLLLLLSAMSVTVGPTVLNVPELSTIAAELVTDFTDGADGLLLGAFDDAVELEV